jgi:hypothetical protein
MVRSALAALLPLALAFDGCFTQETTTALVPANPFPTANATAARTRVAFSPASLEAATRVDTLGRKLIDANPQAGLRPMFRTIGAPQPEIFHNGTFEVDITEGLVKQCKTDGELAAVLCHELGKMVSEREALAGPKARTPEREPPEDVRVGSDYGGTFGPADQTHLAELAKFDKERHRPSGLPLPPPDPHVLAHTYLLKAGFADRDQEAAAPLLQAAAQNSAFEKQMVPASQPQTWIH